MDVFDSTGDGCSLCGGEGSVDGVRDNSVGPVVPEGQQGCNHEMHQKTHVSLERPFFPWEIFSVSFLMHLVFMVIISMLSILATVQERLKNFLGM